MQKSSGFSIGKPMSPGGGFLRVSGRSRRMGILHSPIPNREPAAKPLAGSDGGREVRCVERELSSQDRLRNDLKPTGILDIPEEASHQIDGRADCYSDESLHRNLPLAVVMADRVYSTLPCCPARFRPHWLASGASRAVYPPSFSPLSEQRRPLPGRPKQQRHRLVERNRAYS
jgi:hypothetical protein